MTQLKFHNYHVKCSEIWLVLPTQEQRKSTVWNRISCQAVLLINEQPGYEVKEIPECKNALNTRERILERDSEDAEWTHSKPKKKCPTKQLPWLGL